MVRVLAVNNYPGAERFARLERCLRDAGAEVTSTRWDAAASMFDRFDGVVLSGAPDMVSEEATQRKFAAEADAVRDSPVPVLGICFGHQLMAHAFGSAVTRDAENVLRFVRTTVLEDDQLFSALDGDLMLLESRHEVVTALPEGFRLLAKSETSAIAAMKHTTRELYGTQFHPERYTKQNPAGMTVVANFVRLLS